MGEILLIAVVSKLTLKVIDTDKPKERKFDSSTKQMSKMLKLNFKYMDKADLDKKKSLLQAIFSVNYDQKQKNQDSEEAYSPGFKNLVNRKHRSSAFNSPMRSNKVYESAKNTISKPMRSDKHSLSSYYDHDNNKKDSANKIFGDYSFSKSSDQRMSSHKLERSSSFTQKPDNSPIRQIRYNEKADRMIALRNNLASKKILMKTQIQKKAKFLQNKNKVQNERISKSINYTGENQSYERSPQNGLNCGNESLLGKMDSGIFKRYAISRYFYYFDLVILGVIEIKLCNFYRFESKSKAKAKPNSINIPVKPAKQIILEPRALAKSNMLNRIVHMHSKQPKN